MVRKQFDRELGRIVRHEVLVARKKNRRVKFLVHWKGEDQLDDEWVEEKDLWQFEEQIAEYWRQQKELTRASTSLSGGGLLHP